MTRKARLAALVPSARHSSSFALSALMAALAGCATVQDAPDDVKPPPQITTVGGRAAPAAEGPLSPVPGIPQPAPRPATKTAPAAPAVVANATPQAQAQASAQDDARDAAGLPVDPLNPDQSLPINDANARKDLWGRVRTGFGMPNLENDLVSEHVRWYASRPDYVRRMTDRGSRYLFHVVEELQRRNMPTELALLPFIESAFNPQAMSSARASGMWQFMPMTGKTFELKQNMFRDERRDVLASTRAAMDYLSRLHKMFGGDWQLALAAYNWGEGNVKRAIASNERQGLATDYSSLSMPAETRHYVPKLQAVKNIVLAPQNYGLELPQLQNHPYFLSVPIRRDIDVTVAARLAGMSIEDFKDLNPQMNKPVILASGTPQILLPYDNAAGFVRRLQQHTGPLASWTAWVVPRTMRSAEAARQVGMSEADLRSMNRIPAKMLVKAGSTLLIQRGSESHAQDVPEHVADNAHMALAPDVPPLKKVAVQARRGDTVLAMARRYHVTASQIAHWNRIDDDTRFKRARSLVLWVPANAVIRSKPAVDEDEDERPSLAARKSMTKRQLALAKAKAARDDEDDEEDTPVIKGKTAKRQLALAQAKAKAKARGSRINADDDDEEDTRVARKGMSKRQLALADRADKRAQRSGAAKDVKVHSTRVARK